MSDAVACSFHAGSQHHQKKCLWVKSSLVTKKQDEKKKKSQSLVKSLIKPLTEQPALHQKRTISPLHYLPSALLQTKVSSPSPLPRGSPTPEMFLHTLNGAWCRDAEERSCQPRAVRCFSPSAAAKCFLSNPLLAPRDRAWGAPTPAGLAERVLWSLCCFGEAHPCYRELS